MTEHAWISSAGVIDALASAALVLGEHGEVLAVNRRWRDSPDHGLGIPPSVQQGVDASACLRSLEASSEIASALLQGLDEVMAGRRDEHSQEFSGTPGTDGQTRWHRVELRSFAESDGRRRVLLTRQDLTAETPGTVRDTAHLKQTQEALRESQHRFNELATHLEAVFWVFDWNTRDMIYLSPSFAQVFGRPVQELLDRPEVWIDSVHPDDRDQTLEAFRTANQGPFDLTYRIVRPTGEERWIRDQGYPVRDALDRVVRLVGIAEDVTDRVLADQKVKRSEERYRAAAEAGLDAFFLLDAVRDAQGEIIDFVFTDLNRRGAELVSRLPEQVIGQRLCELLPVNRCDQFFGAYKTIVETGAGLSREFRIDAAEEGIQASWLEQQVVRVGDGIAISARDITQRKASEQEIARQREENQIILDALPAFVFYKDTNNRILRVNRAVCEAEGLPADQIEGRHTSELYPETAEAFYRDDLSVIRSRQPKLGYVEKMPAIDGGDDRWVRTDKVPLYNNDREPSGVIVIAMDVTELKHTTEKLEESERRYRELFNRVPVAVWEQDLTRVGQWLDGLRSDGVTDLLAYLRAHPEAVQTSKQLLVVKGVNQAAFELLGADNLLSITELLNMPRMGVLSEPWVFKLQSIWDNQSSAEMETYCYTVEGDKIDVLMRLDIPEVGGRLDLSRTIIALTDISENRQRLFAQSQVIHAERERLMLGHELHDTLAQQLTGINMLTESLRRRLASQDIPEAERVAELAGMVGQANSEVRRLLSGLSAERIVPDEIEAALESLAERSTLVHQLPVTFHCLRTPDELSEEAANHLLYIAQEATHNAAKHAAPTSIQIALDQSNEALTLTVADDGCGLPATQPRTASPDSGLGLNIMRYRAEAIGATMSFSDAPDGGTVVVCTVPLHLSTIPLSKNRRHDDFPGVAKDD